MPKRRESGAPGSGAVDLYVSEMPIERPVQMRLKPPGRDPVNLDMTPAEAQGLGMGLINAADQARAQHQEVNDAAEADSPG